MGGDFGLKGYPTEILEGNKARFRITFGTLFQQWRVASIISTRDKFFISGEVISERCFSFQEHWWRRAFQVGATRKSSEQQNTFGFFCIFPG